MAEQCREPSLRSRWRNRVAESHVDPDRDGHVCEICRYSDADASIVLLLADLLCKDALGGEGKPIVDLDRDDSAYRVGNNGW